MCGYARSRSAQQRRPGAVGDVRQLVLRAADQSGWVTVSWRTWASTAARSSGGSRITWLREATRSSSASGPSRWVHRKSRVSTGPNGGPTVGAAVAVRTADDLVEPAHPAGAVVAQVPQDAEPAAGERIRAISGTARIRVHPVPGLGHQHHVDRVVRQRDRLRRCPGGPVRAAAPGAAGPACPRTGPRRSRRGRVRPAAGSACRCRRPGRATRGGPAGAASRARRQGTAAGRARRCGRPRPNEFACADRSFTSSSYIPVS